MCPKKHQLFSMGWSPRLIYNLFSPPVVFKFTDIFLKGLTCWPIILLRQINCRNSSMHLRTEITMHTTEVKALLIFCKHGETTKQYVMDSPWPYVPVYRTLAVVGSIAGEPVVNCVACAKNSFDRYFITHQHKVLKCRHQPCTLNRPQGS